MISNPEGQVEVVGLVSWGIGCGFEGIPSVFTKVQFYLDWIYQNIQVGMISLNFTWRESTVAEWYLGLFH